MLSPCHDLAIYHSFCNVIEPPFEPSSILELSHIFLTGMDGGDSITMDVLLKLNSLNE